MRIAICFFGHIRDFSKCIDSLKNNLIEPLNEHHIDIYGCFWDTKGIRVENFTGENNSEIEVFKSLNPKELKIIPFDRNNFISKYTTNQWTTRPHLSCFTTSGDAASMWYMANECFKLIIEPYDLIIRTRSDLIYDTPITSLEVKAASESNLIYIPKWRGKYYEVSKTITDYFAFGDYESMKCYLTLWEDIDSYLRNPKVIHTAEGLLLERIKHLNVHRTNMRFSAQRKGFIENVME